MTLRVALQMDPLESINIDTDSTFMLGLEAQRRGYELFHYTPAHMLWESDAVKARMSPVTLERKKGGHFRMGEALVRPLSDMDVIFLRQDPPFDMRYMTTTYMLERVHGQGTLVVNNPVEVRNCPEKLLMMQFKELIPPTLITDDRKALEDFYRTHRDIILKPLYGNGGLDVLHLSGHDRNFSAALDMYARLHNSPVIAQKYLSAVREGDKRILLVDGIPVGALNRVPADNETRANLHVGGTGQKSVLTPRDQEICATIGPELKKRGLIFTGIDVIGNYLTEINVTSPTCIQEINQLDGSHIERDVWDAVLARLS